PLQLGPQLHEALDVPDGQQDGAPLAGSPGAVQGPPRLVHQAFELAEDISRASTMTPSARSSSISRRKSSVGIQPPTNWRSSHQDNRARSRRPAHLLSRTTPQHAALPLFDLLDEGLLVGIP